MNWIIREATEADAEKITAFMHKSTQELAMHLPSRFSVEEQRKRLQHYVERSNAVIFVVEHDDQVVGYAQLTGSLSPYAAHVVDLDELVVLAAYRRQGIGKALMQTVVAWAEAHPRIERLLVDVPSDNVAALEWIQKLGFQWEGVRDHTYLVDSATYVTQAMAKLAIDVVTQTRQPAA